MHRKFIATIAAAAVTITALGASSARADEDDVTRALAALLGIAVIGAIINDNDDHVGQQHVYQPRVYHPRPRNHPRVHQPRPRNHPRVHQPRPRYQPHVQPRPVPDRVNTRLLPGQCLRSYQTRRGTYRGFGQRCLRNNYRYAHQLPNRCLLSLRTRNGDRNTYEARCLRNAGYRLARR